MFYFNNSKYILYHTWSIVGRIPLLEFSRFAWSSWTVFACRLWTISHYWFFDFQLSVESNTSGCDTLSFWNQFAFGTRAISPNTLMFVTTKIRKHSMIAAPRTLRSTSALCNLGWLKFAHFALTANVEKSWYPKQVLNSSRVLGVISEQVCVLMFKYPATQCWWRNHS